MSGSRLKTILLRFTIMMTLIIIVLSTVAAFAFLHFEKQVQEKLQLKKILQKTEYYAASRPLTAPSRWSLEEVKNRLLSLNYRERRPDQSLLAGDWSVVANEICQKELQLTLPSTSCLVIHLESEDRKENALQENDLIHLVFNNNTLESIFKNKTETIPEVWFRSILVAQYVGKEPVLQNEVPLNQVPALCSQAVIAIEDNQFLDHSGISFKGLSRAVLRNITEGRAAQGGSTITQQLVKNYFLTNEKTLKRKVHELWLALAIEKSFTKDQILETYLNIIYMGQSGAYQVRGYAAAAQYYFSKPLAELNLSECSLLAAIVNSPGLYNPFRNPEKALSRRQIVLQKMLELQFINEKEKEKALTQGLPNRPSSLAAETAPYYLDATFKTLSAENSIWKDKLSHSKIYLGLNLEVQSFAQSAMNNKLQQLEAQSKKILKNKAQGLTLEGMVLVLDHRTGLLEAAIGGRDFRKTQFNRVIDSHRQIGSLMKPFVFLAALENQADFEAHTILKDEKFTYKYEKQSWSPENYDKTVSGDIPAFVALMKSLNIPTAKLGLEVGLDKVISVAQRLGIQSPLKKVPSLTLGAFELYPLEVLSAYATIAANGESVHPSFVRRIEDAEGNIIFRHQKTKETQFSNVDVARLLFMLRPATIAGTAKAIQQSGFAWPAAGKTGTTSDNKDAWFVGFTAQKTVLIWLGYDKNQSHGLTGGSAAVPIWIEIMNSVSSHEIPTEFTYPSEGLQLKNLSWENQEFILLEK